MRKKIIEKIFGFLLINADKPLTRVWNLWLKLKLYIFLALPRRLKTEGGKLGEVLAGLKDEQMSGLIKLLAALYGELYKEMYFLHDGSENLKTIEPDFNITEVLWGLQRLPQIVGQKPACLFYQTSFRNSLLHIRDFIKNDQMSYLDWKAAASIVEEICELIKVPPEIYKSISDLAAEEFLRLNKGAVKSVFTKKEMTDLWEKIYEQETSLAQGL